MIDPTRVSDDLGGEDGVARARRAGLDVILDIVPNHMAAVEENRYWADPSRCGRQFFDLDPVSGGHRRFFDIDELAGVRQEDPEVFAATHEAARLVAEGLVDGLRVDHPDGLADPAGYLERLRERGVERSGSRRSSRPGRSCATGRSPGRPATSS